MSKYDEDCEEDQRNFFDVFVQALEGADRVIIETRNALGDFDAHYMTAPKLLTKIKELKAQIAGLLKIVGNKHDAICRIEVTKVAQLEWQPIETAPKEVSDAILYENGNFLIGYKEFDQWFSIPFGAIFPTHWMPLPNPPKEQPDE